MSNALKPNRRKAIFLAKKSIAQIVTDVVNLEDINYTVPEVQTLLDGITVGGHKLQDELIVLNQIKAWRFLFESLDSGTFEWSKDFLYKLHSLVAYQEALEWGKFRTGMVSISGTSYLPPLSIDLDNLWEKFLITVNSNFGEKQLILTDRDGLHYYEGAIFVFAEMSRTQFFYDGNKRTARMMMSGILLDAGYPMINIPASRKHEFNQIMIEYYETQDLVKLSGFLFSCIDTWLIDEFV